MKSVTLTVRAGNHSRRNCPVWLDLPPGLLPEGPLVAKTQAGAVLPCQVLGGPKPKLCLVLDTLARGAVETLTVGPGTASGSDGVRLSDTAGEKVTIAIDGKPFTTYHYAATRARPFLMPIAGPFDDPITRRYPVESVEGETKDHPHHKSLWVAWGNVNGSDHWSETEGHGRQVHQAFEALESGPAFGRLAAHNRWVTREGNPVLQERRSLTFYNTPSAGRLVDLEVTFLATEGPVTFGDTKEGGLASIRVATSMDAAKAGTIVNSYGGVNEAETWGKRAHWCDYVGPVNGKTVGIAILDTPGNFRYPTYWHVRNYGLMTANPFGVSHFTGDKARDGSHTIPKGTAFRFQYRFYFHAGSTADADVAGKFLDHVAPPAATLEETGAR